MPEETVPDNRPPEGEIPDILEWKLDVIMAQLAKLGGGQPSEHNPIVGGTRVRLPPPKTFNPATDDFPNYPGIPNILEWKLEVIMTQLGKMNAFVNIFPPAINIFFIPLIFILVPGLGAVIALLIIIVLLLAGIQATLFYILALLLFLVVQIAVPFIIARNRRKLRQMFPGSSP